MLDLLLSSHAFSRKARSSVEPRMLSLADRFNMLVKESSAAVKKKKAASGIEEFYLDREKLIDSPIEEMQDNERQVAKQKSVKKAR